MIVAKYESEGRELCGTNGFPSNMLFMSVGSAFCQAASSFAAHSAFSRASRTLTESGIVGYCAVAVVTTAETATVMIVFLISIEKDFGCFVDFSYSSLQVPIVSRCVTFSHLQQFL